MLKGSIVALITPFKKNQKVDYQKLLQLLEFQCKNQTKNLLVLGTTSESPTLTDYEKEEILNFVVKHNRKRMKLVVGLTSNNTLEALEKAKKYEALGADYLLVITPYYNKCNNNGLIKHFTEIAESVNIPILLYNIPSRTGVNIGYEDLKILKEHPNIIGVKEANRDITHILDVDSLCDENFKLYCGNDDLISFFLTLNCVGFFNVYGNLDPKLMNYFYEVKDDMNKVQQLHHQYYKIFKSIFLETNPIPIKALMNHQGFEVGLYRLPLYPMSDINYQIMILEYQKVKNYSEVLY